MIWKTTISFFAALFLSMGIYAQSCPQNNVNVLDVEFRNSNGDPFLPTDDYEIGTPITGQIFVKFGGSTTNAADLRVRYSIYVDDIFFETREVCLFEDQFIPLNTFEYVGDFTWNWGSELEIKDIFMRWQTGNTAKECPSLDSNGAQCYGNDPGFIVRTPLVANFAYTQDCNSYDVTFEDLTTGGYPPESGYTYTWNFKDESGTTTLGTSDQQNLTYTFPSSGNYEVTLSSSDGNLTKSETKTVTVFEPGDASISYDGSPYCAIDGTASITQTGVSGGTFEASSNNLALNTSTGEINLSSSIAGTYTVTYYFSDNGCDYTTETTITIKDPAAPTGEATQDFCAIDTPTVADLVITGTNIIWYSASTGGVVVSTDTALNDETTYYASQTIEGCESDTRLAVTADIADPAAPTGEATQDFCAIDTPTVADLVVTGTNIIWYSASTGGAVVSTDTALTDETTYYASQTIDGCESDTRFAVTADIADPAAPTGEATQDFCAIDTPTVADLVVTGTNIIWYSASTGSAVVSTDTALTDETTYYASQTIDGCESDTRFAVTADIADPAAPIGEATQDFCAIDTPTVADLVVTGTNIIWYSASTGSAVVSTDTALNDETTYYASQTIDGCESDTRLAVTADIADPAAPTGEATQDFCAIDTPTVADLVVTGTNIIWYSASTGGAVVSTDTALNDETTYYASQTIDGCESDTRLAVTADIADPAAPTGEATQDFCAIDTPTVADLVVTGTNIIWYSASTGGAVVSTDSALTDETTYYASQTIDGCESDTRLVVTADIADPAAPTGEATQDFCAIDTPTVADLVVTGTNIIWYSASTGGAVVSTDTALTDETTYYASQTIDGCESDTRLAVTADIADPAAPTGEATQDFCAIDTPTVADLVVTGTNIIWYSASTGGAVVSTDTALTDETTYYASQTIDGCESDTRLAVTADIADPAAPTGEATQDFCAIDTPTVADLVVTGTNIIWYSASTGGAVVSTDSALTDETTYYASQTIDGCESDTRLAVTADIANPAAPNGEAVQTFCFDSGATVADLSPNGNNIVWYINEVTNTPLLSTDTLLNGEDYYAAQIIEGCVSLNRLKVVVEILPEIELSAETTSVTCNGEADGEITVTKDTDVNFKIFNSNNEDVTSDNGSLAAGFYTIVGSLTSTQTNVVCTNEITVQIEVLNNIDPEITVPESLTLEICTPDGITADNARFPLDTNGSEDIKDLFEAAGYSASDDQELASITYTDNVEEDGDCFPTIIRTFYATDNCGGQSSASLTITLEDNSNPYFNESLPQASLTVECDSVPEAAILTADDNCSGEVTVTYNEEFSGLDDDCANEYTITRNWYAEDCSGKEVSFTQVITVEDNTAPEFDQEILPTTELIVECDNIPAAATLTATDNCAGALDVTYTEEFTGQDDECANEYTIVRKWTAADCAGNVLEYVQTITVEDTVAPEFDQETLPTADLTVECDNIPAAATLTATDNCAGDLDVNYSEEFTGLDDECANEYTIVRKWTAADCAGNDLEYIQTITVEDNSAPVFNETLPEVTIDVECDNIPEAVTLTATDNCSGELTVNYTEEFAGLDDDCSSVYTITRNWTAADCAGNEISHTQVINVTDTTAPEFNQNIPADMDMECENLPEVPTITATDNCEGDVTVEFTETSNKEGEDDKDFTVTRTWTATDCAGNITSQSQNINIINTGAPSFNENLPNDITVECDAVPEAVVLTASDNCIAEAEVTFEEVLTGKNDDCANEYSITRTWTASDEANNETVHVQVITVIDSTAPEFDQELPETAITVECTSVPEAMTLTATDNCSETATVNFNEEISERESDADNNYRITRTWTASDCAGNETTFIQVVNVEDKTAPVITECAAEVNVSADAGVCDASGVQLGMPSATDNCDTELTYENDAPEVFPVGQTIVTWTITDASNNSVQCEQMVNVTDDEAPVVETISDINIDSDTDLCGAVVAFESIVATDNCEIDTIEVTEGLVSGSVYPIGTTTVIITVTDMSGNITTTSFDVTVTDSQMPEVNCPDNIITSTEAGESYAIVNFENATATDNCEVSVEQTGGPVSGSQFEIGTTTVTFTATDASGNQTECSFTVTVEDDEDPTLECPSDYVSGVDTGICGAVVEFETPVGLDNSNDVTVTQTGGPASGDQFPVGETVVEFTATDAAGNSATCNFTVTIADDEAPQINDMEDITVNNDAGVCGAVVSFEDATATDNCGVESIIMTEGLDSGSEFPLGKTTVTYVATDTAGLTATTSFTVTVIDNEAPSIECPENITIDVAFGTTSTVVTYDALTVTDNCGGTTTTMTSGIASGEEFPVGETTITYTVTDDNGNEATCEFTVTVNENEAPAPPPAPNPTVGVAPTCANPLGSIVIETQEGVTYSIDGENYVDSAVFENIEPGTYEVTVKDEFGQVSDVTTITIENPVASDIELVNNGVIDLCIEDSIYDLFELFTGDYDDSGVWVDTENSGALDNGFIDPSMLTAGQAYTFEYQVTGNCNSTTEVSVLVNDDCIVLDCSLTDLKDSISKAVTPNGDNRNDFFEVDLDTECGFTYDLKIFNRWGAEVFTAQNYQNNWDGFSKSSFTNSNQLPSGTYFYILEIRNSEFKPIQGYIYLGTK